MHSIVPGFGFWLASRLCSLSTAHLANGISRCIVLKVGGLKLSDAPVEGDEGASWYRGANRLLSFVEFFRHQTKHGMFTATDKTCLDGKASCTESSILHEVVSAKVFEFGRLQDLLTMRHCREIKSRAMKSWPATSPLHFDIWIPSGLSSVGRCAN